MIMFRQDSRPIIQKLGLNILNKGLKVFNKGLKQGKKQLFLPCFYLPSQIHF